MVYKLRVHYLKIIKQIINIQKCGSAISGQYVERDLFYINLL